jgi:hypothetical protein
VPITASAVRPSRSQRELGCFRLHRRGVPRSVCRSRDQALIPGDRCGSGTERPPKASLRGNDAGSLADTRGISKAWHTDPICVRSSRARARSCEASVGHRLRLGSHRASGVRHPEPYVRRRRISPDPMPTRSKRVRRLQTPRAGPPVYRVIITCHAVPSGT